MTRFQASGAGLKVIVAYKLVKGALQAAAAAVLFYENARGGVVRFARGVADWVERAGAVGGLGSAIAAWIVAQVTPEHVLWVLGLLVLDACSTTLEGVGLHYRQRWAAWLVVVATAALMPFELYELAVAPGVFKALVLLVNAAIVVYLARRVLRRQARQPAVPSPDALPRQGSGRGEGMA